MKKRILSILLIVCVIICLVPTSAFAEGETTENSAAIQLGTSGISGYDSTNGSYDYIYFGTWNNSPAKWRVLDTKTNMPNAQKGNGFFLLSDALLGTGEHGDVYFDDTLYSYSNVWQDSKAKTWCNNFYSGIFSDGERGAVLATTKSDGKFTCSTFNIPFAASENILNGDKVFFLSAEEAENSAYGFDSDNAPIANYGDSAGVWWLRSPVVYDTRCAGIVTSTGYVNFDYANEDWAARPAFNLNPNSVLFISAAAGGKSADGVFKIPEYSGNEWKLTLLDDTREFAITEQTASGKPSDTIMLNYIGAATGTNEYISVIIADNRDTHYYGRVAQPTGASGQIQMKIPASLAAGTYTLSVFSEQCNGDYKTDYASGFQEVALTVEEAADEQFDLAPGGTYWFDLSGAVIPGTAKDNLPDKSMHYVPFTYAGTVDAYKLTSEMETTEEYAQQNKYAHSLFIADYDVTYEVNWEALNDASLIFGKGYAADGVDYTLRAPSVGSDDIGSGDSKRGTPQSNEWDRILDKNNGYIKNWSRIYSWGQDTASALASTRAVRGNSSARTWWKSSSSSGWGKFLGFRPVLEVLNPDTMGSDGLKAVALDLGGGKLGGSSDNIRIIVKNGGSFTAPASDGLTRPDGDTGSYFMWRGSDGKLYAPGDNASADVTKLTAQFAPGTNTITITTDCLPDGKVGVAYSQTLIATGTKPTTWSISGGALPDGLKLDENTGEISGTPTAAETAGFTVKASNSAGSDTKELSITIAKAAPSPEDLVDPVIRIVPYEGRGYPAQNGTRTAADFFEPGKVPEGAKITAITAPASPSILDSISVGGDGTLSYGKDVTITEPVFKSETYIVTITSDDCAPISAPLTVRQYLYADFGTGWDLSPWAYGDTRTYKWQVTNPGENGVWSALIRDPEIFEICQETTDITSELGKSIYTVRIRAIKASAGVTCIDFLYFSDTTMASSKDVSEAITGGGVSTRPLTVTAGSASITKGDALPTGLVTCTGLLDSEGRRDDRDTVLENALSYRLLDASGVEVAADTARNTPGTYTVVPAAALKSGWEERYSLNSVNGTLTVEDKAEFTVTVTSGGNGMASAFPAKAVANTEITLTAMPDKGYHFKEWQVVSGGVTIANNKFTMPSCNVEIKAIFEEDAPPAPTEYTVTFDGNGGTPSVGSMTTTKQKLSSLPSASRRKHSFDGWYTEKSGGTKITTDTVFSENSTVYARWIYTGGNSGSSSSSPIYPVSVASGTEKGTVTVSPRSASKGDTVTITVKPDSGYVLDDLTVTDKNGNELKLTDKGDGKYTFTMPSGKVEVKASFVKEIETSPFSDVVTDAYYYEAVKWAAEKGITGGIGNSLFGPNQPCTRAQIVTFLWRAAGSPEPKGTAAGMTDVVSGSYYEKAVAWAIENGVTTGTTTTTFSPDATCTRAQAVTFLARALNAKATSTAEFSDVPTDSYFAEAVAWAAANGVTEGVGNGLFAPHNNCTRAQIVTFLYRAYNK